jgi:uncharacterized protein YecE (DUF72 family)
VDSIYIGVAGFSYKDWEGIVYPQQLKRRQHPVEYLAQYFDVIEINTSFYGHIRPEVGRLWARKAAVANPNFRFTAKLNKAFTHSPLYTVEPTSASTIRPGPDDERLAKEGYDSLASEGRLGALLAQFPISFKNTPENQDYLTLLARDFSDYPLVVEVRHSSWNDPDVLQQFLERGLGFCNIDQPMLGRALAATDYVTSPVAYVRLHGRNYDQWFEAEKPHDRYNYLYTQEQLQPWKGKIESVASRAQVTFVVANNHFEGKGAVNALQLKAMIEGRRVKAPESLLRHYPELESIAERAETVTGKLPAPAYSPEEQSGR